MIRYMMLALLQLSYIFFSYVDDNLDCHISMDLILLLSRLVLLLLNKSFELHNTQYIYYRISVLRLLPYSIDTVKERAKKKIDSSARVYKYRRQRQQKSITNLNSDRATTANYPIKWNLLKKKQKWTISCVRNLKQHKIIFVFCPFS